MSKTTKSTSLGTDPEVMLLDTKTNSIVSALRILGRNKHDPIDLKDGMRMYADNVLVEAAMPPAVGAEAIVETIRKVFSRMQEVLTDRYTLLPQSAFIYPDAELKDPECWEAGCNPNFDVYMEQANPPAEFKDGLRTGSFHIHIGDELLKGNKTPRGWDNMGMKAKAIRLLDVFLGCSSVIFDKDISAPRRRALYGRSGEFRPTPYGCEYRVLGNWPLRLPDTTRLVYDIVAHAVAHLHNGTADDLLKAINSLQVQEAINSNDKALAKRVLEKAGMPYKLMQRVEKTYDIPSFREAWGI